MDGWRWRRALPTAVGVGGRDHEALATIGRVRAQRPARLHLIGVVGLAEFTRLRGRLGPAARGSLRDQVATAAEQVVAAREGAVIQGRDGEVVVVVPARPGRAVETIMGEIVGALTGRVFSAGGEHPRLTPLPGYALVDGAVDDAEALRRARIAVMGAAGALDMVPVRYNPDRQATRSGRRRRRRARYRTGFQIAVSTLVGVGVPFGAYSALFALGIDPTGLAFTVLVIAMVGTAFVLYLEQLAAVEPEPCPAVPASPYPAATAVIAAYLPNESATIVDTIEAFLRLDYPGPLRIVLAYNTPRLLPVEETLARIAAADRRFLPLRVPDSTSKAQNVNAALAAVTGEFVGVFDADHQPAPDAFTRAWHWLSHGATVVQGRCVVRNGDASPISRTVAVEFESIYGVSHPGRARMHGFGIFGGSNGYWRTEALHQIRMRATMLTEDIDASLRTIIGGGRIVVDPRLLSYELAPTTLPALWRQRMRWAQGWAQVSRRHLWRAFGSPALTVRQKLGLFWLLGWREVYPWLSLQMYPLILISLVHPAAGHGFRINISLYLFTALFSMMVGPTQALFAYALADASIRRHRRWFIRFCLVNLVYSEFKNVVARLTPIKALLGEHDWHVTPRAVGTSPAVPAPAGPRFMVPRPPSVPPPPPPSTRPPRLDRAHQPSTRSQRSPARPVTGAARPDGAARVEFADLAGSRGLAAVLVMIFHAYQFCRAGGHTTYGQVLGATLGAFDGMISWFFVVSAFLLYRPQVRRAVAGQAQDGPGQTLARRGLRILPLYYGAVLLVWAARNPTIPGDWRDLLEHLTFTQVFDSKRIFYTIGPAWSLAVEVFFYVYLSLVGVWLAHRRAHRLPMARRWRRLYLPAVALIVLNAAWFAYIVGIARVQPTDWAAWFGPQDHASDFGLGMIVAVVYERRGARGPLSARSVTMVRIAGIAAIVLGEAVHGTTAPALAAFHSLNSCGFALLLASSVMAPRDAAWRRFFALPAFVWLGAISYSAYLWHEPILLLVLDRHGLVSHAPSAFPMVALTLVACGIAGGYLSYVLLEKPAGRLSILLRLARRGPDGPTRAVDRALSARGTELAATARTQPGYHGFGSSPIEILP